MYWVKYCARKGKPLGFITYHNWQEDFMKEQQCASLNKSLHHFFKVNQIVPVSF